MGAETVLKDKKELFQYLRQFGGHPLAYSALQDGMKHFIMEGRGFIPYALPDGKRPVAYCLSDPVAAPGDYPKLTGRFLERFQRAAFIQVRERFAESLAQRGFYANEMGVETEYRHTGLKPLGQDQARAEKGHKKSHCRRHNGQGA